MEKLKDVLSKEAIETARLNFSSEMESFEIPVEITTEMVEEMEAIPSDGILFSHYLKNYGIDLMLEISGDMIGTHLNICN